MTIRFDSPLKFAEHLTKSATTEIIAINKALEITGMIVQANAKSYIGHLQGEIGGNLVGAEWDELAESTKADKQRMVDRGHLALELNEDFNPLMRTGELYRSIKYTVNMADLSVTIGSDSNIAAYQEFGTNRIPPRPFIGRAAYALAPAIASIFGNASIKGIAGGNFISSDLGYELGYHQDIKL